MGLKERKVVKVSQRGHVALMTEELTDGSLVWSVRAVTEEGPHIFLEMDNEKAASSVFLTLKVCCSGIHT